MKKKIKSKFFRATNYFLPAFRYQNLQFFGGRKDDVALENRFDLLINLTGTKYLFVVPQTENTGLFAHFLEQIEELKSVPQLVLKWADYDIPDLPPSVWFALVKDLQAFERTAEAKKRDLSIAVFCQGGTGRTGTALAILRNLLLKETCDPVAVIRRLYKSTAIETSSQIAYVEYVTGVESNCVVIPKAVYKGSNAVSATTSPAVIKPGSTCTHTLAIQGCKGGCVEYYSKKVAQTTPQTNEQHNLTALAKTSDSPPPITCLGCKWGDGYSHHEGCKASATTPDCPACKIGGTGIAHTLECNTKFFERSGLCPECFEDVSKYPLAHKTECSKHPDNDEEEEIDVVLAENSTLL